MAALKIFAVRNKSAGGKIERLVKATTRGEVRAFLANNIDIESMDAAALVDALETGLKVEDATQVASTVAADDEGGDEAGAVTPAAAVAAEPVAAEPATAVSDAASTAEGAQSA